MTWAGHLDSGAVGSSAKGKPRMEICMSLARFYGVLLCDEAGTTSGTRAGRLDDMQRLRGAASRRGRAGAGWVREKGEQPLAFGDNVRGGGER